MPTESNKGNYDLAYDLYLSVKHDGNLYNSVLQLYKKLLTKANKGTFNNDRAKKSFLSLVERKAIELVGKFEEYATFEPTPKISKATKLLACELLRNDFVMQASFGDLNWIVELKNTLTLGE